MEHHIPIIVHVAVSVIGFGYLGLSLYIWRNDVPNVLCEPADGTAETERQKKMSFSRIAGVIGAINFSGFFAGLGIWVLLSLSSSLNQEQGQPAANQEAKIGTQIDELWMFFLAASAFFFPYAFNQLASVWRKNSDGSG